MTKRFDSQQHLWILLIAFLVACAAPSTESAPLPEPTPVATQVPSHMPSTSAPTIPALTATASSAAPEGLRMAYVIEGNIYLQDGNNPPIQLTDRGEDKQPTFSEDGKKIVFLRGFIPHDLYSINTDGSQEQVVISGLKLSTFAPDYSELSEFCTFAFVPGTHNVVFNIRELDELDVKMQDWNRTSSKNKDDLLIVDTDTGEIKSLLSPGKGGNFVISPDGKTIAVQAKGHIDVVSLDGLMIRRNLITYTPTRPYELVPGIFWTANSTELIVTLPVGSEYDMDGPETRSVWRYTLDGSVPVQISLDPPPIGSDYSISPDGNWILYDYYQYPGKTDETVTPGLYLGNLHNGDAQLYSQDVIVPVWSSDSKHFIYVGQELFLGMIGAPPAPVGEGRFLGWGDANHFLYFVNAMMVIGDVGGSTSSFPTGVPESSIAGWPYLFNYIFRDRSA